MRLLTLASPLLHISGNRLIVKRNGWNTCTCLFHDDASFEVVMAVTVQNLASSAVTPCSLFGQYRQRNTPPTSTVKTDSVCSYCHVFELWLWMGMHWMTGFIDTLYTPFRTTRNYSAIADHTLQFSITYTLVVSWQRIYNSLTVSAAHINSSFHSLIPFLPSSSTAIPRDSKSKSKLCYDRRSAGQSILEQSTHLGLTTRSYCLTFAGLLVWGALSDARTDLPFAIATGPR
jgi:hypothetical protein